MSKQTASGAKSKASAFVVKRPFSSDSPGDCIIQTTDGAQFVVYRAILSLASSVWSDMFSLPQPSEASPSERPIIPVDEDSETMQALLTMLYPMQSPRIESYDLAIKLIQACDKYFISMSMLLTLLFNSLLTDEAFEKNPLGVYALAWKLKMEEYVKFASRYTHRVDLYDQRVVEKLIQRTGGLDAVMALWDMRRRREAALDGVAKLIELDLESFACPGHRRDSAIKSPSEAVEAYLRVRSSVSKALQNPHPVCKSLQQFFGFTVTLRNQVAGCQRCRRSVQNKVTEIITSTDEAIEKFPQTIQGISNKYKQSTTDSKA